MELWLYSGPHCKTYKAWSVATIQTGQSRWSVISVDQWRRRTALWVVSLCRIGIPINKEGLYVFSGFLCLLLLSLSDNNMHWADLLIFLGQLTCGTAHLYCLRLIIISLFSLSGSFLCTCQAWTFCRCRRTSRNCFKRNGFASRCAIFSRWSSRHSYVDTQAGNNNFGADLNHVLSSLED